MAKKAKQYLVFGGVMEDVDSREFKNSDEIEIVGIFPSYEDAYKAWQGAAQRTVDSAETRFFIVAIDHMQKISEEPEAG